MIFFFFSSTLFPSVSHFFSNERQRRDVAAWPQYTVDHVCMLLYVSWMMYWNTISLCWDAGTVTINRINLSIKTRNKNFNILTSSPLLQVQMVSHTLEEENLLLLHTLSLLFISGSSHTHTHTHTHTHDRITNTH